MNRKFNYIASLALLVLLFFACKEEDYTIGELVAPSNLVINTTVIGQDAANPNGDGSGKITVTAKASNAFSYKIAYTEIQNTTSTPSFESMTMTQDLASANKKFSQPNPGTYSYRITVVAYGAGGTSTTATKDVTVLSLFNPDPAIITNLTNNSSKTWKVDQTVAGHFGVGPWSASSATPQWWSAAPNEKVGCCNCFYTARFTFTQVSSTSFSLNVSTPDGAFTKTGSLASIPGIPASGDEGCYGYGGAASSFSFVSSSSGIAASAPSTQTSILLGGSGTFIGYGSLQKEYEIMVITPTYMYLRVQGTETGNAWYLKLIPA